MSEVDIASISEKRYTTKHYDGSKEVSKSDLIKLLTVLRNSPSSVNSQPWHFFIINNKNNPNLLLSGVLDFNHSRIADSTYTIVFCIRKSMDSEYLEHLTNTEINDNRFENLDIAQEMDKARRYFVELNNNSPEELKNWESKQLYLALGQFMFAAAAIGIDTTAIEGFNKEEIDNILNLKEKNLESVVIATIGYRSESDSNAKRPKSRLKDDEIFTLI
ncbi:nitroreductase family protein [Providencia sp. PROV258]|uniref:nitroreductase family protein n=1 Tax=Providencia sp. PROV258 TaxID=2949946 RepID=UPI00234A6B0F|nr:nitroreductase family protein [Providencia sp. PROV258]